MKKLIVLGSIVMLLGSCSKSESGCQNTPNTSVATSAEITWLQNYAATNYPAAIQHSSGIFYEVTTAGTGAAPSTCSTITVNYNLYELPSNVLVPQPPGPATFSLGGLIAGWQIGIPLIKAGGTITLLIPPSLSYKDGVYRKFIIQLVSVG